jgi:ABC-2 type transport system permease protein
MNNPVVRQLILKDWRLHRAHLTVSVACGIAALGIFQIKSPLLSMMGAIWFFVALIVLGSMLPMSSVLNERKKQNLAFLMSLPVSSMQYTLAKVVATFGMFFVPWLALVVCALSLIASRSDIPHGIIPLTLVLAGLALVGFCAIDCVAIVTESEGPIVGTTIVCNSSYGVGWYFIANMPAIKHDLTSHVAVWSPAILKGLTLEFALIALMLSITFYLQSRKQEFI